MEEQILFKDTNIGYKGAKACRSNTLNTLNKLLRKLKIYTKINSNTKGEKKNQLGLFY